MITMIITVFLGVLGYICASNGEWGSFTVSAVLIVIIVSVHAVSVWDARAWVHRTEYWASRESERARDRIRGEMIARRELREEAERNRTREQKRNDAKVEKKLEEIRKAGKAQTIRPDRGFASEVLKAREPIERSAAVQRLLEERGAAACLERKS